LVDKALILRKLTELEEHLKQIKEFSNKFWKIMVSSKKVFDTFILLLLLFAFHTITFE
jgi:hypothetical protein